MPDPSSEDMIPLDRWVVPLDDSAATPTPPTPPAATDLPPELLRFPLDTEVPTDEFQPRLLRFGKAG